MRLEGRLVWSVFLTCVRKGVGPLGFSMTLFQSLAFSAGYDPSQGPGSSCNADGASGQCVLPWAGGTKTVSSVVLISNGISFAVSCCIFYVNTSMLNVQMNRS